jgi:ribonucleoside-diphosphate reductase alpha chain
VAEILEDRFARLTPGGEDTQDIVEEFILSQGYPNVAKAYTIYRQRREDERRLKKTLGIRRRLPLVRRSIIDPL